MQPTFLWSEIEKHPLSNDVIRAWPIIVRHASNRRSLCLSDFVEPELIAGRTDDGGMDWAKKKSHSAKRRLRCFSLAPKVLSYPLGVSTYDVRTVWGRGGPPTIIFR